MVAYQGVPGVYSETAAGKAYPGCETIPPCGELPRRQHPPQLLWPGCGTARRPEFWRPVLRHGTPELSTAAALGFAAASSSRGTGIFSFAKEKGNLRARVDTWDLPASEGRRKLRSARRQDSQLTCIDLFRCWDPLRRKETAVVLGSPTRGPTKRRAPVYGLSSTNREEDASLL